MMMQPISRSLRAMKRKGGGRTYNKMAGLAVSIWSGEHHAWWRDNGQGYTDDKRLAWVVAFEVAYQHTNHCGPEKRIVYVERQEAAA